MEPERWRQIDEVLQGALERGPGLRDEFLVRACGEDGDLLEEVVGLLEAAEQAGTFLAVPCALQDEVDRAAELPTDLGDLDPGERVGAYRLIRPIGRGGMGIVYLAERADEAFEQRVAIKIVRRDLGSAAIEARLRAERQILASLEHPAIARLLDGGSSEAGVPYLVMEYVDGSPIDDYCDLRRLDVRARLKLFLTVCSAVQYAHQKLVVHRDLKPTNVLVTDDGTPKLLDFGIAKLLQPSRFPLPVETTWTGLRPMTPSYASPEQLTGRPVTTASDVYSLGVILYRLLTGTLPRRLSGLLPADVAAMLQEPTRPSLAVRADGPSASLVAGRRSASTAQLSRQLRGDLDNIALKALRSDPEQRYASVAALEEDLRRHLTGHPVRARPPSWRYQSGKFLRRNWLAAAATTAFFSLLLVFTGTMTVQRGRLAQERDRAEAARERSQLEQQKAEQIAELIVGIFDEVGPERSLGSDVTVREVLDRRAESLASELSDQPELLATLEAKMGDVYRRIGAYREARILLEEALRLREDALGPDDPLVAATLSDLGTVYAIQGDVPRAERLFERAVILLRQAGPDAEPALLPALGRLAIARSILGDLDSSEALTREVMGIQARRFGEESAPVAHALHNLGIHKGRHGELDQARELLERALAIQAKVLPEDEPNLVRTHHSLGVLYRDLGLYPRAREHLTRALEGQEQVLGHEHDELGQTHLSLGDLLRLTGELDGAGELYRRASEILQQTLGDRHPRMPDLHRSLGRLAAARGDLAEAERRYRSALELRRRAPTGGGPEILTDLTELADLLLGLGSLGEAERLLLEAEEIASGLRPTASVKSALARALVARAELHDLRSEPQEAAAAWRRAVELTEGRTLALRVREARAEAIRRLGANEETTS